MSIEKALEHLKAAQKELEKLPDQVITEEPERISVNEKNAKLLWCPFAITHANHKQLGTYRKGYPEGAVVHFTAGRSKLGLSDAKNTASFGERQGHNYFVIASTGEIIQNSPLNRWGSHAGASKHPRLGSSVSQYLVGIEICCAGKLDKDNKSWFGEVYGSNEVRVIGVKTDNMQPGRYHAFTKLQEDALTRLLLWLKANNESVFDLDLVVGHDEVCDPIGRKDDPGGSLSMSMKKFREKLKLEYK